MASQEVIKELGTNGGGFFNANSAHPFENPTALSNFFEMLLILMIPAALTSTYGRMVGNRRQGWAIFSAMSILFIVGVAVIYTAEQHGTPAQHLAGVTTHHFSGSTGGNLEGKEQRFGITNTALWSAITTVTSCGAVNARLRIPHGPRRRGAVLEPLDERGGVRRGRHGALLDARLRPAGRLHRRPDGGAHARVPGQEDRCAGHQARSLAALFTPLTVLITASAAIASPAGKQSISAAGPNGFSENLYAYLSQANNNGSAWAGYTGYIQPNPGNLGAHGVKLADIMGGLTMVFARFAPIVLVLAIAGTLVSKKVHPAGPGTMRTDTPTFVVLLIGVIVLVGALTFFPAILLGPIVQSLTTQLF